MRHIICFASQTILYRVTTVARLRNKKQLIGMKLLMHNKWISWWLEIWQWAHLQLLVQCAFKKRANCGKLQFRQAWTNFVRHQHTFEIDMHIQLSSIPSLLLYLPKISCDSTDIKQCFPWWTVSFSEKNQLCSTLARNCFLHWPTASSMTFCDTLAHVSMRRCFESLVSLTGDLWNVHTFLASVTKFCSQHSTVASKWSTC